MTLEVRSFLHEPTSTYSYVVWDTVTRKAAIIDPALDFDPGSGATGTDFAASMSAFIHEHGLEPLWVLETHAHADHLSAAPYFKETFPRARVAIGRGITDVQKHFRRVFNLEPGFAIDGSQFDRLLDEGDTLPLGELAIRVIATPGHTADSLTYVIADAAFVGDSVFMRTRARRVAIFRAAVRRRFTGQYRSCSRCPTRRACTCVTTTLPAGGSIGTLRPSRRKRRTTSTSAAAEAKPNS